MEKLTGTKTEQHLKDAFAGESKANRRYLYFANMADIAGATDVANIFRHTAEGETGHAHGHMEYLIEGIPNKKKIPKCQKFINNNLDIIEDVMLMRKPNINPMFNVKTKAELEKEIDERKLD